MKVSLNWIKQYLDFELPAIDDLERKIGAQLGAIEETENLGEKYKGVVVARIVACADHPNADRLHVCTIDDGGITQGVNRDQHGYVQVVCGAPNAREGILVAWLPPGTTVPETYNKEPFVLEARELRGVVSNGMLASARELALGTDHNGIVEIDIDAKPGDEFAEVYQLDDQIIDIENKMFTHRPDCFGQLGVAREISGILGQQFVSPDWYKTPQTSVLGHGGDLPLEVRNELPDLVPRFMAVVLSDITIKPLPLLWQTYLLRAGVRPINSVVDITNLLMLLTGQPLHAYDYDKVKALCGGEKAVLAVRYPRQGEKLLLLNGKEIEPRSEAIMIATDKQAIGLGGVMGGGDTEVDEHTKNIILECATFDMYSIRRTSMAHGVFTDAVTRFNKGQSPLQNDRIVSEALRMLGEYADAKLASDIIDDNHAAGRAWVHPPVPVSVSFVNQRLGLKLSADDMKRLLENVEFTVEVRHSREGGNPVEQGSAGSAATSDWVPNQVGSDDSELLVTAPFWRTDIELREDVVEEVGRLYGYDHLPLELPTRTIEPTKKDPLLALKQAVRENLARGGANEVLTYSFVHGNLLDKVGQDRAQAFQLSNALSPDLQYYRLSILPSLRDRVHPNIKAGYDEFALFEMGRLHTVSEKEPDGVPREVHSLGFVVVAEDKTAKMKRAGAPYYYARKYLVSLLADFNVTGNVVMEPLAGADLYQNPWVMQMIAPFEPNRSAILRDQQGLIWGVVGEFKASVRKSLKLPDFAAGFEIDPTLLLIKATNSRYVPLPRFPKVEQDICLKVPIEATYRHVYDFAWQKLNELKPEKTTLMLGPVDIYKRGDDHEHKQITLRLSIASYERTLTDEEIAKLLDDVADATKDSLGAEKV